MLPVSKPPPVLESPESSTTTNSLSTTTTTVTASTVDVDDKIPFSSLSLLPNLGMDNVPVLQTIRSSAQYPQSNNSRAAGSTSSREFLEAASVVGFSYQERARHKVLSEIVSSEEE